MSTLASADTSKDNVSPGERVPRSIRTQAPSSISQLAGSMSKSAGVQEITPFPAASIAGADEAIWLYLCATIGVIVGGICFKIVLWAGKSNKFLSD